MHILDSVDAASLRTDIPDFRGGDTVKVHVNIVEGTRSRIQVFQGVVIGRSGEGIRETFCVRKVSFQVGVERTFPVHSPKIVKVEVSRRGRVRRGAGRNGRAPSGLAQKRLTVRRRCSGCNGATSSWNALVAHTCKSVAAACCRVLAQSGWVADKPMRREVSHRRNSGVRKRLAVGW